MARFVRQMLRQRRERALLSAGQGGAAMQAVWALGFRPFFVLAGTAAALLVAAWILVLTGQLAAPAYFVTAVQWHAHEMLFGFVAAAVVGFVLTASQNWTGVRGIRGLPLQALAGVWLAGRALPWLVGPASAVYAAIDLAFLPLAGAVLARYLLRAGQAKNLGFLGLVAVMWTGNLLVHLEALGLTA
jgi:uncharacterized protein involved in response to NO